MQLKREIEYHSSSETIDCFENFHLEWPFNEESNRKFVITCDICFYPITFAENILDEIKDENNIPFGFVVPIKKLFKKVGILSEDPIEQWRTEVFCPSCGLILSFLSPHRNKITLTNFTKLIQYINFDDQIVILWKTTLYRDTVAEAHNHFIQMNE